MIRRSERIPYPGLRAFAREESDLFFGREGCVDAMMNRLSVTRFLAVLGASGGGKSSLVRTGLLDALELGLHPWAGSRWNVADFAPGGCPIRNLAAALLRTKDPVPAAADIDDLASFLAHGPRSVVGWAASGNLEEGVNLLILADQFEELFRYGDYSHREEAEAFVALLLESAASKEARIHVVITMRSEYLGACALIPGLAESINAGLYLTPRLTREECREAIEGPAAVMGFKVEPALVNRLLNDLARFAPWESGQGLDQLERLSRRSDQLPLMQHVLNRLWAMTNSGELRLADYDRLGGLAGALDAHGADVIAGLSPNGAQHVEGVFRALMSGASIAVAVRRPCRLGELIEVTGGNREGVMEIVTAFSRPDCSFLRTSDPSLSSDDTIVDISHESLIRQWQPLRGWLEQEARDDVAWRRLIAAEERYASGEGGRLTGLDLHNLQDWWQSSSPTPQRALRHGGRYAEVKAFLEASERAEVDVLAAQQRRERRERVMLWAGLAGLTVLLAVTIGALMDSQRIKKDLIASQQRAIRSEQRAIRSEQRAIASEKKANDQNAHLLAELHAPSFGQTIGTSDASLKMVEVALERMKSDTSAAVFVKLKRADLLEQVGDAENALKSYGESYREGKQALAALPVDSERRVPTQSDTITSGVLYAWFLFDTGDDTLALNVLDELRSMTATVPANSRDSHLAYARFENLENRYFHDLHKKAESSAHLKKAIELARPWAESPEADVGTLGFMITLYGNLDEKPEDTADRICRLADRMAAHDPRDRRTARGRMACLRLKADQADEKRDRAKGRELLNSALAVANSALAAAPQDQEFLLARSRIKLDLADLLWNARDLEPQKAHRLGAKQDFVNALKERTLSQNTTDEAKTLYDRIKALDFDDPQQELVFYKDIADAIAPTATMFPKARSFAFVWADASSHTGALLSKDTKRLVEAERYLTQSVNAFEKSRALEDLSSYSEDFTAYCGGFANRARLYAAMQRPEPMLADIQMMKRRCTPVLEKYPFDFYLRDPLWGSAIRAGKLLFELRRYADALPQLTYASHWGSKESSQLLARMYREGLGVSRDARKSEELEALSKRQGTKRFLLDADFNGMKAPFFVYVIERPAEYPYMGIDDQIKWLEVARGGKVDPAIPEAFRKLHQTARKEGVGLGDLCVYALGAAAQQKGTQ